MNNHHQATLPFDLDDIEIDTADPAIEHQDDLQPLDNASPHDDADPTYPTPATKVIRPRPSSKHTVAAFPHGNAAEPVVDVSEDGPAPFLLTIPEAGRLLGLGRTMMYELIGVDEIEVVHIGRAARIPVESIEQFVDRLRSVSHPSR